MSLLPLIFALMVVVFASGVVLGWLIWRYNNGAEDEVSSLNSEINFWRKNHSHCRLELSAEQDAMAVLREERTKLKSRIQELEKTPDV